MIMMHLEYRQVHALQLPVLTALIQMPVAIHAMPTGVHHQEPHTKGGVL
jgi:hypothetical protein